MTEANWAGVSVEYDGKSGDLIAVSASYDETGRYGLQSPFSDVTSFGFKGGRWHVDSTRNTLITMGYGGAQPQKATLILYHAAGRYELPARTLKTNEQVWVDVGKIIRQQLPDKDGNVIPPNTTSGSYELLQLENPGQGELFEGKLTIDKTFGHATYGCGICCGWSSAWLDTLFLAPGGDLQDIIYVENGCSGYVSTFSPGSNWSSAVTGVATAASTGIVHGVSVGTSQIATTIFGPTYFEYEYQPGVRVTCPKEYIGPAGPANVVRFEVQGNPFIFVGSDPALASANKYFASDGSGGPPQPTGGTFSATSSDAQDTFTTGLSPLPWVSVKTTDQSTNNLDRHLSFKYALSGGGAVFRPMDVTARQFAYATNGPLSNTCSLGYGYSYDIVYTPYTHPDRTAVQPGIGLDGTAVTETFDPPNIGCGNITGPGGLNANSQFTDRIVLCSTAPLPTCSSTNTQTIRVAGYLVRTNQLTIANTGLTYTNQGPNQ